MYFNEEVLVNNPDHKVSGLVKDSIDYIKY